MTHVSNVYSVVINAAPETVFNYVSDLTRHPEWSGGKLKIEALTPGPVGIGSSRLEVTDASVKHDKEK